MTRLARLALSLVALLALLLARPSNAIASIRGALDACSQLLPLGAHDRAASTPVSPGCAERAPSSARASTAKGETDGAQRALAREHRRVGASNHPDHLGSTSYVTDAAGDVYEHTGYFPHGETWIDQANSSEALPYLFTGKELDQETGLYYFGARYYDPQTALWQSADPALNDFLSRTSITPSQLSLYSYSYNNPIILKDPDGRETSDLPAVERLVAARVPNDKLQAEISDAFAKAAMIMMVAVVETAMGPTGSAHGPANAADAAQGENSVTPGAVMFAVALKPLRIGKGMLLADSVGDAAKAASKAQKTVAQGAKVAQSAGDATSVGKAAARWRRGDDVYQTTARGDAPSWSTVRSRFWKNESMREGASQRYGSENMERISSGRAPQRFNHDKGGMESMELSHEPVPARSGGREFTPRWPQDHAVVDPYRRPGY